MEFGALQCKPKKPNCENCPFRLECVALKEDLIGTLPFKEKKIKQRNRYFNYLIIENENSIYIKKRGENDIWQGLFDFPLIETEKEITDISKLDLNVLNSKLSNETYIYKGVSQEYKHILSHQKIYAKFWRIELKSPIKIKAPHIIIKKGELTKYPVPKLIDNYMVTTNFSTSE